MKIPSRSISTRDDRPDDPVMQVARTGLPFVTLVVNIFRREPGTGPNVAAT